MTQRRGPNIAASVRQRLLNKARETGHPFSELLQYFAMERFLYRLSKSAHAGKFVLKAALMFTAWQAPVTRPTMDIDLLGITDNSVDAIVAIAREICLQEIEPAGLVFEPHSIEGERMLRMPITEAFVYDFAECLVRPASPCNWISVSVMSLCPSRRWLTIQRS